MHIFHTSSAKNFLKQKKAEMQKQGSCFYLLSCFAPLSHKAFNSRMDHPFKKTTLPYLLSTAIACI